MRVIFIIPTINVEFNNQLLCDQNYQIGENKYVSIFKR